MEEGSADAAVALEDGTTIRPAIHHVNLKTTRLDELIAWYGLVVGLVPNFRDTHIAFLGNDAANHRLALLSTPGLQVDPDKVQHDGMHHTAWEYGDLDELLATYARLKREGIVPHGCLDHGLTMSFYYLDPDGNSVELQADNYGDWAESTEFIRTDTEFKADPIGKAVDPDAILEARLAGMDPWEIHERAFRDNEFAPAEDADMRLPS